VLHSQSLSQKKKKKKPLAKGVSILVKGPLGAGALVPTSPSPRATPMQLAGHTPAATPWGGSLPLHLAGDTMVGLAEVTC
jgi:hypothetical protein